MQAGIGETKNWFGKKLGSNEDRGTSSSCPNTTRPLIKFQSFRMATAIGVVRECSLDFNEMTTCFWMSLDRCVSCMAA